MVRKGKQGGWEPMKYAEHLDIWTKIPWSWCLLYRHMTRRAAVYHMSFFIHTQEEKSPEIQCSTWKRLNLGKACDLSWIVSSFLTILSWKKSQLLGFILYFPLSTVMLMLSIGFQREWCSAEAPTRVCLSYDPVCLSNQRSPQAVGLLVHRVKCGPACHCLCADGFQMLL